MLIAHKNGNSQQELTEHLINVASLAEDFAKDFNSGEFGYEAGLNHDIGKASNEFQKRINGSGIKCDHSTAGAKEIYKIGVYGKLMSYVIAGHHTGLMNSGTPGNTSGGTLYARLASDIPDYESNLSKINLKHKEIKNIPGFLTKKNIDGFTASFFARMIYSCVTDADFLDTEKFMNNGKARPSVNSDFNEMLEQLNKKLSSFPTSDNPIFKARNEIQKLCLEAAKSPKGLFSLTVPTGAGKTLSSMVFALNHLNEHKLKRIIYVIPYTSIIEQTAAIFSAEDLFGEKNILQHYSGYDYSGNDDDFNEMKRLAAENWDMPIIITTNVQFFESLFAAKSSKCRKLHNIANSVIIFDEAQMFPTEFLFPCVRAIAELVKNYGCTALLCSATQPALNKYFKKYDIEVKEIIENIHAYDGIFKRCDIEVVGRKTIEDLAQEVLKLEQCMVIVNTKKHARELYEKIKGEGSYHLSTWMYPEHRKSVLQEIKNRLLEGKTCRVISTRLVEAGVDIDFPVVYRAKAGLDSIVQSAGRCNREGKLKNEKGELVKGKVIVFDSEDEYNLKTSPFKRQIAAAQTVVKKYADIVSNEAIEKYFEELYFTEGKGLDSKEILERLNGGYDKKIVEAKPKDIKNRLFNFQFEDIAKDFKLIDDNSHGVVIPIEEECRSLISCLQNNGISKELLRKLQKYIVNVYDEEIKNLTSAGKIEEICGIYVLTDNAVYSLETGLDTKAQNGTGIFI